MHYCRIVPVKPMQVFRVWINAGLSTVSNTPERLSRIRRLGTFLTRSKPVWGCLHSLLEGPHLQFRIDSSHEEMGKYVHRESLCLEWHSG